MEILIGIETLPKIMATVSLWEYANISSNESLYKLSDEIVGTIYIHRECQEGKDLKEWIAKEENRNNLSIHLKCIELALPRMSVQDFLKIIKVTKKDFFNQGYMKAQRDIRNALGIR